MQVTFKVGDRVDVMLLNDDSTFIMDEPRGFVRVIERGPEGNTLNYYFNMEHLICLGPERRHD